MAVFLLSSGYSSVSPADYEKLVGPKVTDFDPDNPPAEISKAAAELGISAKRYKQFFYEDPNFCEATLKSYANCERIRAERSTETSHCPAYLELMNVLGCPKVEDKH